MRYLKYGGDLEIGDFIGVAYNNTIDFGWYCGDGKNTLQYYYYKAPLLRYEQYIEWANSLPTPESWMSKIFQKGFTKKCLYKSYVNTVYPTRVVKILHPEEIFTEVDDREFYEKSKEILINLNFIKQ